MSKDLVQGSRKHISLTSWVAFCLCMLSFAARAQVDQGTVTGTVMDQEGAVIPNANATVTDLGTALKLETPKPAQLCKIFLDKISEDDLRCSRPRNVYVIIIENPPIRRKSRGLAVRSHCDHLSLNLSDRTTPRLGVRLCRHASRQHLGGNVMSSYR